MNARARRTELALGLLLLVAYGWLFVFFPRLNNPNELVRVYMARAIAEQHSYAIGQRVQMPNRRFTDVGPLIAEWGWVNDKSLVCDLPGLKGPNCAGALYSGKAPGVSLLAAPIVWIHDALSQAILQRPPTKDEYVLVLRWLLAILPSIALWLAARRFLLASGVDEPLTLTVVLAGACGSLSYTFGQMVASHQLTGIALAAGFFATFWPDANRAQSGAASPPDRAQQGFPHDKQERWRAAIAGFALSASVCIEYQSAPAAMILTAAWLLVRWRPLRSRELLVAFALGALPFAALFVQFHTAVYGAPWRTGYSFLENAGFQRDIAPGFMGISIPTGERVWGSFFSPAMGLFFFAPWTALALGALPGAWRTWRSQRSLDAAGLAILTALAVVLYYLAFQSTHALWRSGWTVGPRYITPLAPFAALAVALSLQRLGASARALGVGLLGGSAAAAIAATGLASSVCQGFPDEPTGPLAEVVAPLLSHGWVPRNLLQLAGVPGLWSALPTFLALALAILACLVAPLLLEAPSRARRIGLACALVVAAALSIGQWSTSAHDAPWPSAGFLSSQWTPLSPPGVTRF